MRETQDSSQIPANQSAISNANGENLSSPARSPQIYRQQKLMGSVYLPAIVEQRTHLLLTLVGYGLIILGAIDYVYIIFPPHFTDPMWELQTIGQLAERAVFPLIGLVLVFYRYEGDIWELERKLLGAISWVALLMGILYFLMLPLGINDTWRLYQGMNNQISMELSQKGQQIQQIKSQLDKAKNPEQLQQVLASIAPQQQFPEAQNLQESKAKVISQISQVEKDIRIQANKARSNQTKTLLKNAVKAFLGAVVAGTLFIVSWHLTDWARNQ
jgi:hypothetical protein